jgi:hypothetical protein
VIATPTPPGQPVSKSQYESTLGPVLNDDVVPALRAALANGGINHPSRVARAIRALRRGRDAMAAVNPPLGVADLHREAVATLSFMVADAAAIRRAEVRHDARGKAAAARALQADATQIQAIGNRMTARGF